MNTRHLTCISSYHNRARCCSRYGYHIPSHSEPALCCHDVCVCVFSTMTSTMAYSGTSYVIHIVDYNYSSGVLNLLLSLVVIFILILF